MIFLTVGMQLPFDRLVRAMDGIAPGLGNPVFAQIGTSGYAPRNFEWVRNLPPSSFNQRVGETDVIVSHAGIGTVLAARRHRKPLIIVPRRAALGEHRNDHQLATCRQLAGRPGIHIAEEANELADLLARQDLEAMDPMAERGGRRQLLEHLRSFFETT